MIMLPELTEAWGVAYFQILITLVVFAIGIPTFFYNMEPEDIRHIIKKYLKLFLRGSYGIVCIFMVIALSFVWYLHPAISNSKTPVPIDPVKQWLSSLLITFSLSIILIIWWVLWKKSLKETVLKHLGKTVFKGYKKKGFILNKNGTINDLITLGERSDAGYEKEIVIKTLESLLEKIQGSKRYSGKDLDSILRDSEKIVVSKDKPGNETDFQLFVDTFDHILKRLSGKKLETEGDQMLAYNVLTELGKKAAELKYSGVVLRILTITVSNPESLFEIGLSAFKSSNYHAALTALNTLESLSLNASQIDSSGFNELFGLLAHFWTENKSSRRRAEFFLLSYKDEFPSLETLLDKAIDNYYNCARYETADKLISMREELIDKKRRKKTSK